MAPASAVRQPEAQPAPSSPPQPLPASPVSDLPSGDTTPPKLQSGKLPTEHRPEAVHTPGAGAALKGESASGPETTTGTPGRRSSAPLVWAAGSAVLGVLLFFSALTQFVTANPKLLWQIVLVAAILGVLTGAFERPLKWVTPLIRRGS
jgi:hypothetical protein